MKQTTLNTPDHTEVDAAFHRTHSAITTFHIKHETQPPVQPLNTATVSRHMLICHASILQYEEHQVSIRQSMKLPDGFQSATVTPLRQWQSINSFKRFSMCQITLTNFTWSFQSWDCHTWACYDVTKGTDLSCRIAIVIRAPAERSRLWDFLMATLVLPTLFRCWRCKIASVWILQETVNKGLSMLSSWVW